jgi:hypothetical protein
LALLSEPMVERTKKHVPCARWGDNFDISPSSDHFRLLHIESSCENLTPLRRGSRSSHQTHWVRWRQCTRSCSSQFAVPVLGTQLLMSHPVQCSTGATGESARLPVLAPASVDRPRVAEISPFERRRHIAVTACSACRAKKRKVGFNETYPTT